MRVDDWICLGRTVPEESKKYGHRVCSAGYSHELNQFMRIYPLPVQSDLTQRAIASVELSRNSSDSRRESWCLANRDVSDIRVTGKASMCDISQFLSQTSVESLDELNDRRMSIGALRLHGAVGEFVERKAACNPQQRLLFDVCDRSFGANQIDLIPYISFFDRRGSLHRLQVREWGCYEFLRKHRSDAGDLWSAMRLTTDESIAVVGNMNAHRNVWMIISVWQLQDSRQTMLFDVAS